MTLDYLRNEMTKALKNGDKIRKNTLSGMINAVIQKAASGKHGRLEITEELIDEVLVKYQKTVQEQIDTCPASRPELKEQYLAELAIVKEYAPQLLADKEEIKAKIIELCNTAGVSLEKANRGMIMKTISPEMKKIADMKIVNQVVGDILS